MPDTKAILEANEKLAYSVDKLGEKVQSLGHRTKSIVVIVIVLAALVVGVIVNAVHLSRADSKTHRLQEYLTVSCAAGNDFRKAERDLWGFILVLTARDKQQTAAQKKQAAQFQTYVSQKFADRDCTQVAK